jgi:hypothetical protein
MRYRATTTTTAAAKSIKQPNQKYILKNLIFIKTPIIVNFLVKKHIYIHFCNLLFLDVFLLYTKLKRQTEHKIFFF